MKVTDNNPPIQMDAYIKQTQLKTQQVGQNRAGLAAGQGPSDKVQLSEEAKAVQKAQMESGEGSDLRSDKIAQVKMQIDNGTYRIPATQVATDMLKEGFENDLLLKKFDLHA
jgi:flagellar biosynthesis anti-sigma factor FlgM